MSVTCAGESIPVVRLALAKERCARTKVPLKIDNAHAIAAWVTKHYGCSPQENFISIFYNPRMEVIAVHEVALGALDSVSLDPKVVFSAALLAGATAMLVVHNHPSGSSEASALDVNLTVQLARGAEILGIKLLDHLVVARGGEYSSMRLSGQGPWHEA